MIGLPRRLFDDEHDQFRRAFRAFVEQEAVPNSDRWEEQGFVDREFWIKASSNGFLGFSAPQEHGGLAIDDFRFNAIIGEEMMYAAAIGDGFTMVNDIIAPYLIDLTTDDQKQRWLRPVVSGEQIPAIAMTEPGTGSDLRGITSRAVVTPDGWILNGAKTFITSGIVADLIIVAARDSSVDDRLSLFVVSAASDGFERGRKLAKVGRRGQDTAELFFDDVFVPADSLLGEPGQGLRHLKTNLASERLSMAVLGAAASEKALEITLDYCRDRTAFGQPIGSFQANRFALAELSARVRTCRAYVDRCIEAHVAGDLDAIEAAAVKYVATELQFEVLDRCLQLHGGYGYMDEYLISRLWRDGRVQRIYGGTSEIMLEIVGRDLGL